MKGEKFLTFSGLYVPVPESRVSMNIPSARGPSDFKAEARRHEGMKKSFGQNEVAELRGRRHESGGQ